MRSSDRTMIASLGFADPDKGDPTHDLACQYIAANGAELLCMPGLAPVRGSQAGRHIADSLRCTFEEIISKGDGKYQTTVGFIDLVFRYQVIFGERYDPDSWKPIPGAIVYPEPLSIAVEVKTHPIGIGDVLRQIKFYRQHVAHHCWLLATTFPIRPADLETLRSERIAHVVLGDRFRAWVAAQKQADDQVADSPEL